MTTYSQLIDNTATDEQPVVTDESIENDNMNNEQQNKPEVEATTVVGTDDVQDAQTVVDDNNPTPASEAPAPVAQSEVPTPVSEAEPTPASEATPASETPVSETLAQPESEAEPTPVDNAIDETLKKYDDYFKEQKEENSKLRDNLNEIKDMLSSFSKPSSEPTPASEAPAPVAQSEVPTPVSEAEPTPASEATPASETPAPVAVPPIEDENSELSTTEPEAEPEPKPSIEEELKSFVDQSNDIFIRNAKSWNPAERSNFLRGIHRAENNSITQENVDEMNSILSKYNL